MLHRAHHGLDDAGEWAWTPPAGARDPGENVLACARRELVEETGLDLVPRPVEVERDWALFVAEAPAPPGAEVTLDDEHDAYAWLSLDEACARCLPAVVADGLRVAATAS